MFKLTLNNDVTLKDLSAAAERGEAVVRTPHVGNAYCALLLMEQLGIPTVVFDRNFGLKDDLFHPNYLIVGGKKYRLCADNLLMTHARVEHEVDGLACCGERVSDVHTRRMRELYPKASVTVYSDWLREHAELVQPILEACARRRPDLWTRWVPESGVVQERAGYSAGGHFYGLNGKPDGWVLPNMVNVIVFAAIEALTKGTNISWHLCGHDMAKYMVLQPSPHYSGLSELYDQVREDSGLDLPEELDFRLVEVVPASRFVTTSGNAGMLTGLLDTYFENERLSAEENGEMAALERAGDQQAKAARIKELGPLKKTRKEELGTAVQKGLELFRPVTEGTHRTQYDLCPGDTLFADPRVLSMSLAELNAAYTRLARVANKMLKQGGRR